MVTREELGRMEANDPDIESLPSGKVPPFLTEDSPDAGYEGYPLDGYEQTALRGQRKAGSGVYGEPLPTGLVRAVLQPVVFMQLTRDHAPGFLKGTVVAAQYWGAGRVVLTRFPDGATYVPVAHEIGAVLATSEAL